MSKPQETPEVKKVLYPYHARDVEECLKELGLPADHMKVGLTTDEAQKRLAQYGENKLTEKEKTTLLQRIWNQVANVLVGILVFVAVVSAVRAIVATNSQDVTTNVIQVGLIVFVITVNTAIGIYQEGSAEKAADALKAMLSSDAVVVRNGKDGKIPANELVPGDIVKLSLGDRCPADIRMLRVNNLACLEAALTGESVPIEKSTDVIHVDGDPMQTPLGDRHNMCYSSTLVSSGAGTGLVVTTGDYTEIGTINRLVNQVEKKKTNVLEQIDTVSTYLAIFIAITCSITLVVAILMADQDFGEALGTALTAAVAMIPEGLEAIVTMTYAWAVSNMAKKNAIIRALPAVETLGSVTTICSDKTGTLTKNEMTLVAFVTSGKRYRFNVNADGRTAENFCVDEKYMAERADHSKYLKQKDIIRKGPSAERKTRGRKGSSFPFGISTMFGKSDHPAEPAEGEAKDDKGPGGADSYGWTGQGEKPDSAFVRKALSGGILCSKCVLGENGGRKGEIGNPTELSILRAAYFADVNVSEVKDSAPIIAEVPFSSEYKFMATIHPAVSENDGDGYGDKYIVHVKGAPDRMIPLCKYQAKSGSFKDSDLEPVNADWWIEQIAVLSSHGLRVLALTRGTVPKSEITEGQQLKPEFVNGRNEPWLTIVGLCAIMDPPRPECVAAITEAHTAGVRVAMITGDHKDTATAIGGMLGLLDKEHRDAITGPELDAMSDEELKVATKKHNIFARASPQNKIRIVKALQAQGEVCGMTGDGVNDAPALKAADMGVAMGKEGTDVAREAAEMILADDNFATIITAVREGRVVWDDLRKVLLVNTPINNAQGMSVLFGIICGLAVSPLSPIQVLYCNLICAVTLGFVCAVEPAEEGIMEQPPRRVGKRLIGRFLLLRIVIGTATLVACTVGSAFIALTLDYEFDGLSCEGYNNNEKFDWDTSVSKTSDFADPASEYFVEDLQLRKDCKEVVDEELYEQMRAQALNTLSFGAVSITMSARFARKAAFHPRSFFGNQLAWWSYAIMAVLQVFITYTPGLNKTIFQQDGMTGIQWAIVAAGMVIVFVVMEVEKAVRNVLTEMKYDTEDREYGPFDSVPEPDNTPLPEDAARFGKNELSK